MRKTILVVAMALAGALLLPAATAFAGGRAGTGCPPSFGLGAQTLAQALELPRTIAALDAGEYDEAFVVDVFTAVDANENGLVCYQDVPQRAEHAQGPGGGYQYYYNLIDDQSAAG